MNPEDLSNTNSAPLSPPEPESSQLPQSHPELKQIRTFQGDVAGAIQDNNESLVSIQRAEHVRGALTHTAEEARVPRFEGLKKGALLFLGSVVLLGLGGAGTWYAYNQYQIKTAVPELAQVPNRFISSVEEVKIDAASLGREQLIAKVSEAAGSELKASQVRHIQLLATATSTLSSREFFKVLEGDEPARLVRALDPLFMIGAMGVEPVPAPEPFKAGDTSTSSASSPQASPNEVVTSTASTTPDTGFQPVGQSVFLIFKLSSFDNAFAGTLEWEESMASDLGPFFSTFPFLPTLASDSSFKDETRYNKDLRVLRNSEGQIILLYTFFNNEKLIITDSEETMRILLSRLENELLSQ